MTVETLGYGHFVGYLFASYGAGFALSYTVTVFKRGLSAVF